MLAQVVAFLVLVAFLMPGESWRRGLSVIRDAWSATAGLPAPAQKAAGAVLCLAPVLAAAIVEFGWLGLLSLLALAPLLWPLVRAPDRFGATVAAYTVVAGLVGLVVLAPPIWPAMLLQAAALTLLIGTLRGRVLSRAGAIFILLAILYHGVGEVLVRLNPGRDRYRPFIEPRFVDTFVLYISIAIFLLTCVYLRTLGRNGMRQADDKDAGVQAARFYRLVPVTFIALTFVALTASGAGRAAPGQFGSTTVKVQSSSQQFVGDMLFVALALFAVALVNRFGNRWAFPALIGVIAVASLTGQRGDLLFAAVVTLYALRRFTPARISGKATVAGAVLVVFVFLVLTSARATAGRDPFGANQSLGNRYSAVIAGVTHIGSPSATESLKQTLGQRLDGNSFGAEEYQALRGGAPPLHAQELRIDANLAVPSIINPAKVTGDITQRVPKLNAEQHFSLGVGDILTTQLGSLTGWWGIPGLLVFAAVIGFLLGCLDRWLIAKASPARILVGVIAVYTFSQYEGGFEAWLLQARVVLVIGLFIAVTSWISRRATPPRARYPYALAADAPDRDALRRRPSGDRRARSRAA